MVAYSVSTTTPHVYRGNYHNLPTNDDNKFTAANTASEMTCIVSGGALNSTHSPQQMKRGFHSLADAN